MTNDIHNALAREAWKHDLFPVLLLLMEELPNWETRAVALNDAGFVTTSIYEYAPNDFGLYNMAGNVNEWVFDIYRPLNFQDMEDLNPIRKSDFLDSEEDYDSENFNSMISNESRVFKGGSWADGAMWLSPGTRRFLDQDSSSATIGFRCATTALGTAGN